LADFGLARILDETGLTVSGTMLGTPSYMSPEAARGERLDERGDIYSFGIVLYEMVTGTTPYTADTPNAVLLKHIQEPIPSPRQFNVNLPVVVEEILFKALAKKLEERFQSAREFGVAIEKALQQLNPSNNIPHHSPTSPTRVWSSAKTKEEPSITISIPRRRVIILAAVGVSFVIGALLMMAILFGLDDVGRENDRNDLNLSPTIEAVVENPSEEGYPPQEGAPQTRSGTPPEEGYPPEEEPPEEEPSTDIPPNLFDEANPDPTVLLYSNLASPQQIESPTVGQGGMSHLQAQDFVRAQHDDGVLLVREGENCKNQEYQVIRFPMITEEGQNISFDEGEIELWYRPNYDSTNVNAQRVLVAIGYHNIYNPPTMLLESYDRLSFRITLQDEDETSFAAETDYAPSLWNANDWVHIRARWDSKAERNALQLFVNGKHVNQNSTPGGWNMQIEANDTRTDEPDSRENLNIFVGSGTECGDLIADGIIDELLIRNKVN
jgi:hypothetical protein